jgi:hypothetical protein
VHQVVEQFRAVGTSGPLELSDPNDRTFVLGVIEAWAARVGMEALPPGIRDFADALRGADGDPGHAPIRKVPFGSGSSKCSGRNRTNARS